MIINSKIKRKKLLETFIVLLVLDFIFIHFFPVNSFLFFLDKIIENENQHSDWPILSFNFRFAYHPNKLKRLVINRRFVGKENRNLDVPRQIREISSSLITHKSPGGRRSRGFIPAIGSGRGSGGADALFRSKVAVKNGFACFIETTNLAALGMVERD